MLKREKLKLSGLHRGIKDMKHLPSAVFIIDANHEKIAVAEAKCLGIPTFGLVDTNTNPFCLDYPIPANDDSIKTINLIMSYISNSIINAIGGSKEKSTMDLDDSNKNNSSEVIDNQENDKGSIPADSVNNSKD